MSMTRNMAALALMGALSGGYGGLVEPQTVYVPDPSRWSPRLSRWRPKRVLHGTAKQRAKNRLRNRIARASRKANR